jgi:protein TonB
MKVYCCTKYWLSFFIVLAAATHVNTQTVKTDTLLPPPPLTSNYDEDEHDNNKLYHKVEVEASFPGGDKGWREYLEKTLNAFVPIDNGAPAGKYVVIVQFVVDKDGKISDVRALTRHGYGMENEVMRVIKKGPQWEPAIQNGRVVKAYRQQPVTFHVIDEKRKRKNKG